LLVVVGTAVELLIRVFYAIMNLFELFFEDWYPSASKVVSVVDVLALCVLLIGFLLMLGNGATCGNTRNGGVASKQAEGPPGAGAPQRGGV